MRAVAIAEDRTLRSTELEERPLGANEVRVDVAFCGICGCPNCALGDHHVCMQAAAPTT